MTDTAPWQPEQATGKPMTKLGLTPMQWKVMNEIVTGHDSSKAIANALGISVRTAEIHICKAMKTLGVRTRLQAALAFERAINKRA